MFKTNNQLTRPTGSTAADIGSLVSKLKRALNRME